MKERFAIKPMNCPGHCQIYNQGLKSYKDLPIKISEFGKVHRYEPFRFTTWINESSRIYTR